MKRRLAQALDRDKLIGRRGAIRGGHGAGDLLAIYLAEGCGFAEVTRLAIGRGDGRPAVCACGQAPIHTVAVGVVGNDEKALFRMRGSVAKHGRKTERRENAHGRSPPGVPKNVREHARP
jgi:hypothetical protein